MADIQIEITGLKNLNKFIGLEDTPLYYDNGKFFKVVDNKIVYTDITWEDISGEIENNPEIIEVISKVVEDTSQTFVQEEINTAINIHNNQAESHPIILNKISQNFEELQEQISLNKVDVGSKIEQLNNSIEDNKSNIETINGTIDTISSSLESLEVKVTVDIPEDIENINTNISSMQSDINKNKSDISGLNSQIETINSDVQTKYNELNQNINNVDTKIDTSVETLNNSISANTQLINQTKEELNLYAKKDSLAEVATSGNYEDLINKPDIPSVDGLASTEYVDQKINESLGQITGFEFVIVEALPPQGETGKFYLVPHEQGERNTYDEYIWVQDTKSFELVGSTDVDLSNYYNKEEVNGLFSGVNTKLDTKVDKQEGKSLISDAEIERLASVKNYDDTEIRGDISDLQNNLTGLQETKQDKLTAGSGIQISDNTISNTMKITFRDWSV